MKSSQKMLPDPLSGDNDQVKVRNSSMFNHSFLFISAEKYNF